MVKAIMIQGTMSNAGKSLLCAGLCRVFRQDGYRVRPFKAQNMALNSYITAEGLEMGRAQAVQAEACGVAPSVRMNPILLKPVSDGSSQVIVNGEVRGNMRAADYFAAKRSLQPDILRAYRSLAAEADIMVIEGAGSPAEINLKQDDIVNMGMARLADAPVILVGEIDRCGVFAQLYGTIALLSAQEQAMVKAVVINKFRGDAALLKPGLAQLAMLTGKPVAGVLPYLEVDIEDEDSLADRLQRRHSDALIDIAVIRLPRISNFTDLLALETTAGIGVRYVQRVEQLGDPDMVILPGTKSTISDLKWLRDSGLAAAVTRLAAAGKLIFGLCGGYQMLGRCIRDAAGGEGGGEMEGLCLLPVETEFLPEKRRTQMRAQILQTSGMLQGLAGCEIQGYEIHMGCTQQQAGEPLLRLADGSLDGCACGNVYGSYLHGFFDAPHCRDALLTALCAKKGIEAQANACDLTAYKETQYERLAAAVRSGLDMRLIYHILEEGV